MNSEKNIINTIAELLPRSDKQLNRTFESDSEIVEINGKKLLFSIDDYSEEDRFRDHDPFTLGWNLTVATVSDILASGGIPKFYAHSMIYNEHTWDQKFIYEFTKGISSVLRNTNSYFIGGDIGTASAWHYTGVAIGESEAVIKRSGTRPGDVILMTGQVGTGNMEAAFGIYSRNPLIKNILNRYRTRLAIRIRESGLIRQFASSCIDSSDGVMNALIALSELNDTGFELDRIPYHQGGLAACKVLSKPKELLLLGECGEYELIFTIPDKDLSEFFQKAQDQRLSFTPIGRMLEIPERILIDSKKIIDFTPFNIRGRDFEDISLYLEELTHYLTGHEKSRTRA